MKNQKTSVKKRKKGLTIGGWFGIIVERLAEKVLWKSGSKGREAAWDLEN